MNVNDSSNDKIRISMIFLIPTIGKRLKESSQNSILLYDIRV